MKLKTDRRCWNPDKGNVCRCSVNKYINVINCRKKVRLCVNNVKEVRAIKDIGVTGHGSVDDSNMSSSNAKSSIMESITMTAVTLAVK